MENIDKKTLLWVIEQLDSLEDEDIVKVVRETAKNYSIENEQSVLGVLWNLSSTMKIV